MIPTSSELTLILAIGFALSLVVVWSAWLQRGSGVTGQSPLPDASFDFQNSWLTTFTALITIVASISFVAITVASSGSSGYSFAMLAPFFLVLIAAGPLAYKALGSNVGSYLLASAALLWAAFGLVFALVLFFTSLVAQFEAEAGLSTILIVGVMVILIPLVGSYAYNKLTGMLKSSKAFGGGVFFL
jgi:hypothetical protein